VKAAALVLCTACASALHKPPPIESIAAAPRTGADQLLAEADAAWARRAEAGRAAAAEELYLQAARADPRRPESFAGAIRAKAFQLGREKDGGVRLRLAESAVAIGQLCEENAPAAALCDYWLAAALGLQARERSATAKDGLPRMTDLLRRANRSRVFRRRANQADEFFHPFRRWIFQPHFVEIQCHTNASFSVTAVDCWGYSKKEGEEAREGSPECKVLSAERQALNSISGLSTRNSGLVC